MDANSHAAEQGSAHDAATPQDPCEAREDSLERANQYEHDNVIFRASMSDATGEERKEQNTARIAAVLESLSQSLPGSQ